LTIASVTSADSGSYSVAASNSEGTVTSTAASLLVSVGQSGQSTANVALVVGNPSRLLSGDVGLRTALEAQGHTVTLYDDSAANTTSTAGNDLIVISGSVYASSVGARFVADSRPVLVGAYRLFDSMDITGSRFNVDYGRLSRIDTITVLPAAASIGAAAGDVQVISRSQRLVWGLPGASATKLAVADNDPDRATLFSYEAGAGLPGGAPAAGKRMGMYLSGYAANLWTEEGRTLFDQSVAWLLSN